MRVDSDIARAIDSYVNDRQMTYDELSKQWHVSAACITKWRRVGNGITASKWEIVFPCIKPYLSKERMYIDDMNREQYSSATEHQSEYYFEAKYVPMMLPTFRLPDLSDFDDTLEAIIQFSAKKKVTQSEYRPKHTGMDRMFAVELQDDGLAPVLPSKTKLFVCSSVVPSDGNLVIANPQDGEPFVARYRNTGTEYILSNPSTGAVMMCGKIMEARRCLAWIFPVLYYEVITF